MSRNDEQPIQEVERLSLLVTSELTISRTSSVAHLWSLASDHLVFKSMAWPEHLRQYFCDEIPKKTNTIYGHVRMATNSEPLLRFEHLFHWGNQNNGENNGALATRLACISLLKEQFPMLDLPDLSANSDSYDLGLYLTLLQLKGLKIEDVFSHVFRVPTKGDLPVSPIPDAYPPYSGPFYGIYYDNKQFYITAGDLNVRPAFVAYDGKKTIISSEMYDYERGQYKFHSLPTGTWRVNRVILNVLDLSHNLRLWLYLIYKRGGGVIMLRTVTRWGRDLRPKFMRDGRFMAVGLRAFSSGPLLSR